MISPLVPALFAGTAHAFIFPAVVTGGSQRFPHHSRGTGITLVAQRDPIWLAKEVASLDVISNGRLMFGVGYGWNREEMADHGVDFASRRDLVREKVLAMKTIWTEDEPSFSGKFVQFEPMWSWPVQKPHPPIILGGGAGPKMFAAIVEFGDGWIPIMGRDEIVGSIADLQLRARDAARDPIEISRAGRAPPADRRARAPPPPARRWGRRRWWTARG